MSKQPYYVNRNEYDLWVKIVRDAQAVDHKKTVICWKFLFFLSIVGLDLWFTGWGDEGSIIFWTIICSMIWLLSYWALRIHRTTRLHTQLEELRPLYLRKRDIDVDEVCIEGLKPLARNQGYILAIAPFNISTMS